ncbi:MAG: UDP-N-acetylmuramoyl-L-alanyl-D-glutamate--2,6-diaminopimelate ligase [Bacteroidales bacterium]|nr:UDP-N-acetylmuramoyl-L-alanyl-D-glutamate--2,6-diaminopimelate ligase [Bacteroidales bacterium]
MTLDRLISGLDILEFSARRAVEIAGIQTDSRKCTPGSLFVAVEGNAVDGHRFISKAIENGATAIVYQKPEAFEMVDADRVVYLRVASSRRALATLAANFYDNPSSKLALVGVTGTNGKTTTATLLYRLFTALGYECGLISTIANYIGAKRYHTDHTTPDPLELNALLAQMADAGCAYCFMEVSSHAVSQDRIAALTFRGGIFSNLTHDHLDYHKTFSNYRDCKKAFFDGLPKEAFALVNIDDANGEVMVQNCKAHIYRYSCRKMADFRCRLMEETMDGMQLTIDGVPVWTRFIGAHNAYNLLAVYATAILLGADKQQTLTLISGMKAVDGRLEYIKGGNNITAVVDYAHTPDALENVLKTLKEAARGEYLICVFGCGGDRDRTKRPEMGQIAAKYADRVVVTSDNPRTEQPEAIIEDIRAGLDAASRAKSVFITDRAEAIRSAILFAPRGSVILVAGKGHEDYQIIGTQKHHFDDKEVISEVFNSL